MSGRVTPTRKVKHFYFQIQLYIVKDIVSGTRVWGPKTHSMGVGFWNKLFWGGTNPKLVPIGYYFTRHSE